MNVKWQKNVCGTLPIGACRRRWIAGSVYCPKLKRVVPAANTGRQKRSCWLVALKRCMPASPAVMPAIRIALTNYFGSKGSYYRYRDGERVLDAEQQRWIKVLLSRYGMDGEGCFDEYLTGYDFSKV